METVYLSDFLLTRTLVASDTLECDAFSFELVLTSFELETWELGQVTMPIIVFRIYVVLHFVVPDVTVNWGGTKNRTGIRSGVRSHDQNQSKRIHRPHGSCNAKACS